MEDTPTEMVINREESNSNETRQKSYTGVRNDGFEEKMLLSADVFEDDGKYQIRRWY